MSNFFSSFPDFFSSIRLLRPMDVVDIVIVAVLVYLVIRLMRKAHSGKVFEGVLILLLVLWLSSALQMYTLNFILRNVVQVGFLSLVIIFQPEIRRALEKLASGTSLSRLLGYGRQYTGDAAITQTTMACVDMSASRTGALIIFERDNKLDEQVRTGTVVNADISAELLKNIFFVKAPLHDGAVIIRDGRILAGGCMLPMSKNTNLSKELGMRHRAGIGMSEASDALVVIVSEETGAISVAENGVLKRHLDGETLEKLLRTGLLKDLEPKSVGFKWFRGERGQNNGD